MKKHFSLVLLVSMIAASAGAVDYKVNPLDARNILEEAYNAIWNAGFLIPDAESDFIKAEKGAPTYGEIVWDSAAELFKELKLTKKDVFYDLGCGTGKLVAQAYMQTPVKKAVGVDLSRTRLTHAQSVQEGIISQANKVLGKKKFKKKKWEYRLENILETSIDDATVVYLGSTCYSDELMQGLTDRLAECKSGLRVLTLKQLSFHPDFKLVKTYNLPMTWSSGSPVYSYKLEKKKKSKNHKDKKNDKKHKKSSKEERTSSSDTTQVAVVKKTTSKEVA